MADPQTPDKPPELEQITLAEKKPGANAAPLTGTRLPGADDTSVLPARGLLLTRFAEYELLGEIGRGGMGVVYKARHVRLNRLVALKMILGGALADRSDLYRFEVEATAAAQLQHPGIVAVYQIDSHDNQPYISMEYINGSNLAQRVMPGPLPGRVAASYLEATARAIHFAHRHGIIHRDLKPANILLDEHDRPRITDFGLAKVLTTDVGQTQTGTVLGTPSYMSPEQAAGSKDIGPPCDIYSLGAILYEVLTGKPPFRGETALATLTQVADRDPAMPRALNPAIDRDLETICLKCLEKDPGRRYATAEDLAEDLRRYLDSEPISARRMSALGRAIKWVRRKPATAALLAVSLLALVAFGVFGLIVAQEERGLRDVAEVREQGMRRLLYLAQVRQAYQALNLANPDRAEKLLGRWLPRNDQPDLRDWEWYFLKEHCRGRFSLPGHTDRSTAVVFRPDGKRLASAGGQPSKPGSIKVWDAKTGTLFLTMKGHTNAVTGVAYSPDGASLASASYDGTIKLWDADKGTVVETLDGQQGTVTCLAFHPQGKQLVSATEDGRLVLWRRAAGGRWQQVRSWQGHKGGISAVAFSPAGDLIASGGVDQTVKLWKGDDAEPQVLTGHDGPVTSLAFGAGGKILASAGGRGSHRGEVKLWSIPGGALLGNHYGISDRVLALAFSHEGKLAAGSSDGMVRIWDKAISSEPFRFRGDPRMIFGLAFSPDGKYLASAGRSGRLHIWNSTGGLEDFNVPAPFQTEAVAIGADSRLLACAGRSAQRKGEVQIWNLERAEQVAAFKDIEGGIEALAFSPRGPYLACAGDSKTIRIYDIAQPSKAPLLLPGHTGRVLALAFSPDGGWLASGGEDDSIRIWNPNDGTMEALFAGDKEGMAGHKNAVLALAFSPGARRLASGSFDKTVRVWDLDAGTHFVLEGHTGSTKAVAFSPDGQQLASASADKTVRIWDLATRQEYLKLEGSPGQVYALAYHPQGRRLASVGQDHTVRLWDLITTQEMLELDAPADPAAGALFSPDGQRLVCAGAGSVRIWRAEVPMP